MIQYANKVSTTCNTGEKQSQHELKEMNSMSYLTEPQREQPGTYIVQKEEMTRLEIQDKMLTTGMGGALPELDDHSQLQRILDVGCGTGNWLMETARTYPTIEKLVGVDISGQTLAYARAQSENLTLDGRVEFQLMDALRMLEFPTASFDLVNQRLGASWLRSWEWRKVLWEYHRVTRPSGIIRITETNVLIESNSPALTKLNNIALEAYSHSGRLFTASSDGVTGKLVQLMTEHGIQDVQTRPYTLVCRAGTESGQSFCKDMVHIFRVALPFFQKWTHVPNDYQEICQQALEEMQAADFVATWTFLTVWGTKPKDGKLMLKTGREYADTYMAQDSSDEEEIIHLESQDKLLTTGMGGVLPELADHAHLRGVLDVGCGTGSWLIETARTYPTIEKLVGVDISSQTLAYARTQARDWQLDGRVEFQAMDALRTLEFSTASFDLVNQRLGASWLRSWEWRKVLWEYHRVTRPGGIIRITETNVLIESNSPALTKLNTILLEMSYRSRRLFTASSDGVTSKLVHLLTQCGLQNIQTRLHTLVFRAGTAEGQYFYKNMQHLFRATLPFLQKWTRVPSDYQEIYQEALTEMQEPDFVATWTFLTAWGTKP
jgi:ubiquinone/menaquinone biosynthesis C-methylase UbiE